MFSASDCCKLAGISKATNSVPLWLRTARGSSVSRLVRRNRRAAKDVTGGNLRGENNRCLPHQRIAIRSTPRNNFSTTELADREINRRAANSSNLAGCEGHSRTDRLGVTEGLQQRL